MKKVITFLLILCIMAVPAFAQEETEKPAQEVAQTEPTEPPEDIPTEAPAEPSEDPTTEVPEESYEDIQTGSPTTDLPAGDIYIEDGTTVKEMLDEKLSQLEGLVAQLKDKIKQEAEDIKNNAEAKEWQIYLEEDLLPLAVSVLTTLFALLIAVTPWVIKIRDIIAKWKGVSDDVSTASSTVRENEARIASLEGKLDGEFADMRERLRLETETLNKYIDVIKETNDIAKIGFCNMDELVKNGYAREIAKIGEKSEEKADKTEEAEGVEGET